MLADLAPARNRETMPRGREVRDKFLRAIQLFYRNGELIFVGHPSTQFLGNW
jgi:hypothetical protein